MKARIERKATDIRHILRTTQNTVYIVWPPNTPSGHLERCCAIWLREDKDEMKWYMYIYIRVDENQSEKMKVGFRILSV